MADRLSRGDRRSLRAGVRLVWVIDPRTDSIRVHRLDGTVRDLGQGDELDGENVAPGFLCPVRELFAPPSAGVQSKLTNEDPTP